MMKKRITFNLELAIRFLFIVLFLYAALSKLIDYQKFYNDLLNSPILGYPLVARFVSILIACLEIIVSGLLSMGKWLKTGWYLVFLLMVLFTVYIGSILFFSESVPCSCGGIISKLSWDEHLIFNVAFTILSGLGIYLHRKR